MKILNNIILPSVIIFSFTTHAIDIKSSKTIPAGKSPNKVLAVDLENDGKSEVLVSNHSSGRVLLLKFSKAGEVQATKSYSVGANPTEIVAFDMNNDSYKDILIANHETNYFHILYNDGKGGFDESDIKKFPVETKPHIHTLGAGYFNDDKLPDVVIDSWENSQLAVYYGTTSGGFETPTLIDVSEQPRTNLVVGKIDDDDLYDIVTPASRHGGVSLVLAAKLTNSRLIKNASKAFLVKLADANKDGSTDILTVHRGSNFNDTKGEGISLLLGNGKGDFEMAEGFPMKVSGAPSSVSSGDIDGDSIPEIISTNYRTNTITIIFYDEKQARYQQKTFPVGVRPENVALVDLDGDNIKEVVVVNRESDTMSILSFERIGRTKQP